ncbi:MAG: aldehyde ferredoxin oxidoreductase family protein [bacterium]|jgi:aldehyde:ferredoxin oxidoreductase
MYGWTGNIAYIDLTGRKIRYDALPADLLHEYIGGRGLNARLLYDLTDADTDPLGPANPLIFGTGPLTGTLVPANGRYTVTARSPLTGIFGDGSAAGFWAAELKYAGFDALVVTGIADRPVYLLVEDGKISIREASEFWGLDTWETTAALQRALGEDVQAAVIGPAGERLVKYACIINNRARAVGRSGLGAVMGSKKLKAIAVRGTRPVRLADPDGHAAAAEAVLHHVYDAPSYHLRSRFGTTVITDVYHRMGTIPIRNSQAGYDERVAGLTANKVAEYTESLKGCFACPIHCSRFTRAGGESGEGPEYETIIALGPRCGNFDLPSLIDFNHLLNRLGVDTISAGGVISFLMECAQRGLLRPADVDGIDLTWGSRAAIAALVRKIAYREGCGNRLAEGVRALSREIPGSEDFAIHVKGMEPAEQEPRGMKAWGLGWAVAGRGADHLRAFPLAETTWTAEEAKRVFGTEKIADRFAYEGKERLVKWSEEVSAVADSAEMCKFCLMAMTVPLEMIARALTTATGREFWAEELLTAGERIVNLERMYNVRIGLGRADDVLPRRFAAPLSGGASTGQTFELAKMLDNYYRARGWDVRTGKPMPAKLRGLGLGFTVGD